MINCADSVGWSTAERMGSPVLHTAIGSTKDNIRKVKYRPRADVE